MGIFTVGSVVLVNFPYSNYQEYKKRPALIVGLADFNNYIICQITSKRMPSKLIVALGEMDFVKGGLQHDSYIRPDKIHTLEEFVIEREIGKISDKKMGEVRRKLAQLFELTKNAHG